MASNEAVVANSPGMEEQQQQAEAGAAPTDAIVAEAPPAEETQDRPAPSGEDAPQPVATEASVEQTSAAPAPEAGNETTEEEEKPATAAPVSSTQEAPRPSSVKSPQRKTTAAPGSASPAASAAAKSFSSPIRSKGTPTPEGSNSLAVASRRMSGRQVIQEASKQAANMGGMGMSTMLHVNAEQLTIPEEYARFRRRNRVANSYKGPIYVAEDIQVPCHACGGHVDPIRRVPVGKVFFHMQCVSCYLCGRANVSEPYVQVGTQVICSDCAVRGYQRCVVKEEAAARGMCLGAIRGDPGRVFSADEKARRRRDPQHTVNQPTLQGASAPSLNIGARLHTRRNTVQRSFALMQRQQYYTQNDQNLLTKRAAPATEEELAAAYEAAILASSGAGAGRESATDLLPRLK